MKKSHGACRDVVAAGCDALGLCASPNITSLQLCPSPSNVVGHTAYVYDHAFYTYDKGIPV